MIRLKKVACATIVWAVLGVAALATEAKVYEVRGIIPATRARFVGSFDIGQRILRVQLPNGADCEGTFLTQHGSDGPLSCSDGREAMLRWSLDWQHGPGGIFFGNLGGQHISMGFGWHTP